MKELSKIRLLNTCAVAFFMYSPILPLCYCSLSLFSAFYFTPFALSLLSLLSLFFPFFSLCLFVYFHLFTIKAKAYKIYPHTLIQWFFLSYFYLNYYFPVCDMEGSSKKRKRNYNEWHLSISYIFKFKFFPDNPLASQASRLTAKLVNLDLNHFPFGFDFFRPAC